ncbi:MAG: hypothetical protein CMJ62_17995 [Planctomycetaceae bacterium]|nr:hypothetical protein [Planctomycetaceae bacterium]
MICTSCGFDNPEGMNFCGRCSTPLSYLPTGIITYLFTDVEGSTQPWQQYSDRMSELLTRHDALITAIVEEHGGMVVRSRGEGDSLFAVFVRARDGVAAACAIQLAILKEPWPLNLSIKVRMALHTGESELREHDYYGPVVNRCARLRGIAHGGQVVLSQVTAELVQDALGEGVTLQDMGAHRLRGMERPEQVFQLLHPGLPSDFPALESLDAQESPRHNLPAQLTSFIGRDEEIGEVAGLLSSARLVTLAGAGGSGKTRLSQEIGASVIDDYADGVWFIGLAALSDQNMLRPIVAETFDVGEDALHGFLQGKSILIILDNCEHLIAGAATLVQWLLSSPSISVIATSREPLNLAGERMFQVPPLPVPVDSAAHEILTDCPSVQLFQERARAAKPDFELMANNAAAVNQIVRRLDGIPLAIELAASRVKLMQPAGIASRLDDSFKILSGGPVDALPHHQTIERAIDWSYDMLDPDQQMLFRQVSVFRSEFTLEACGAVMGTEDEFEALDAIGELVDKSLVRTMPSGEETRYYLLEPLRQYAAARITPEEVVEAGGRHAQYFQELAEGAVPELHGPRQLEALAQLEREHDNLRVALSWGLKTGDADLGLRIVTALAWFWLVRRHMAEAMDWFDRILAVDGGSSSARASALVQAGFTGSVVRHDDLAGCLAQIHDGLARFTELGDEQGIKTAETFEATILWFQRDLEAANRKFNEIREAHRSYGFEWGEAFCDFFLGSCAWFAGNLAESVDHCSRGMAIFRRIGDTGMIAWMGVRLGNALLESGSLEEAMALYEESLPPMADLGDRLGLGTIQMGLGLAAHFHGDTESASKVLGEAQTNLREGGGGQELAWAISNALIDTSTQELLIEAADRYKSGLGLPFEDWVAMICADGEAWRGRVKTEM